MNSFLTFGILGLVEGLTEFVPVSSSGHLIVARQLLGATAGDALGVDAVLQLAALLALIVYFFNDLLDLAYTLLYKLTGRPVRKESERLLWALIIGTVPAVILGLLLESTMEGVFRNTHLVAYALIAGSAVMFFAEYYAKRFAAHAGMEGVTVGKGIFVGFAQALALVPGMSRSGMTIAGGLLAGLSREAAARFGFLLSIPIILGSGAKKFTELSHSGSAAAFGAPFLFGAFLAFLSALMVIHWLLAFLRTRSLSVFIAYRVVFAIVILFFLPPF